MSPVSARELLVPGLTILGHPNPSRVGERVALTRLAAGRAEELSRLAPLFAPVRGGAPRPLADSFLSRQPIRLAAEPGGFRIQRAANALGASRGSLYDRIEKSDAIRKGADLSASAIEAAAARHAGDLAAMARDLRVSRRALARRMRQLGRGEE